MTKDKTFAFVLMPFSPAFADVCRLGVKEPAESLGIRAERVDEQLFAEGILDRIYRQIDAADIIIADMSGQNPNVFYEVGYAHAKEKLCILLTSNTDDIPFDLKHRRHIVYGSSIQTLREYLTKELTWAQTEIENVRKSRIRIMIKNVFGYLDRDAWQAVAMVDFLLDLHKTPTSHPPRSRPSTCTPARIGLSTSRRSFAHRRSRTCPSSRDGTFSHHRSNGYRERDGRSSPSGHCASWRRRTAAKS